MWAQTGWWVHSASAEYKSEATYNHGSPVKWSVHVGTPWKGLLASGKAHGRSGMGEGQPRTRCPLQSSQQECCQFSRPARPLPRSGSALGTWARRDPAGQSCPTEVPFNLTENNRPCSSWPNVKCHFHANFQAWTQVFVFQGMLQKASAFCTDGYSQDLENNPPELMRLDFPPYEIIISVILLNIKG